MGNNVLEAGVSAAGFAEAGKAEQGSSDAGIFIPRYQGRFDLRLRTGFRNLDLNLVHERGLDSGSYAISKGIPKPEGDTAGYGMGLHYSAEAGARVRIGLGMDVMRYTIPYVEYAICADNCPGNEAFVITNEGATGVAVLAMSVTPSYQVHRNVNIFGGLTMRNHPTIERTGEEILLIDEDVEAGPMNVTAAAGAEFVHDSGLRASLLVYGTITSDPARYAPALAATISIPLIRRVDAPPAPRSAPPPNSIQ